MLCASITALEPKRTGNLTGRLVWPLSEDDFDAGRLADLTEQFLGCTRCQGYVHGCVEMHILR